MSSRHGWRSRVFRVCLALPALLWAAGAWALDLNTATRAQLEQLPRIGVARAEVILNARAHGPFASWADFLQRVPGYGEKSIQHLKDLGVTIDPPATTTSTPGPTPQ